MHNHRHQAQFPSPLLIPPESIPDAIAEQQLLATVLSEDIHSSDIYRRSLLGASAAPVVVSTATLGRLAQIHDAVVAGIQAAVAAWYRTDGRLLRLDARAVRLLRTPLLARAPYDRGAIGTLRPDVLHSADDGRLLVCEINARFPLNGFLVSARAARHLHTRALTADSLFARLQLAAAGACLSLVDALKARFDPHKPLFVLHHAETPHDLDALGREFGMHLVHCGPNDLGLSDSTVGESGAETQSLIDIRTGIVIEQVVLELTQDELLSLSDPIQDALADLSARGRSLNDLRTIFIAHDKRLLAVLCDARRQLPDLDPEIATTLSQCIVPTLLASQYERPFPFSQSAVLKPCSLGKGVGIVMEHTCASPAEFAAHVCQAAQHEAQRPFVVQPYVAQQLVAAQDCAGAEHTGLRLVGTLLSLDGVFYGPGVFRASASELVALGRGGLALFPMTRLGAVPAAARVCAAALGAVDAKAVRAALALHGVALVGLDAGMKLSDRSRFQSLVMEDLGGRPRQHNSTAVDFVWDISVQQSLHQQPQQHQQPATSQQKPPLARSQTDEEFDIHTDSSFEDPPPRCVVLAVLRGDRRGGGLTSIACVSKVLATLDPVTIAILRRTLVRWIVPPEFIQTKNTNELLDDTQHSHQSILAPVLISDTRIRFRRDIIDTTHLPPLEATQFWKAFASLETAFHRECNLEENTFLLPEQTLLFLDNQTFVHRRSRVHDPNRLLWRIRYDPEQRPELDRVLIAASKHAWYKQQEDWCKLATWRVGDKAQLQQNIAESFETHFKGRGGLYWSPTGGTTTAATAAHLAVMPSTNTENSAQRSMLRNLYRQFGLLLDRDTVCVNLFASGNLMRSLEVQGEILVGSDATQLPVGSLSTDADAVSCSLHFGATMLMGWGSRLVQLAAFCQVNSIVLATVKTVVHGGEVLTTEQRALLRRVCHPECRLMAVYGSAECGVFALGESEADGNTLERYRVIEDGVHLEILSGGGSSEVEETEKDDSQMVAVPDGEFGRLVVTNLIRTEHPLVRFDTGDEVRFVSPVRDVIEVRGRHQRSMSMTFGGEFVTWEQVCKAMGPEYGSTLFQLWVMQGSDGLTEVQCAVYSSKPLLDVAGATRRLNILFEKAKTLVKKASIYGLDDPGLLYRSKRSDKLLLFVDLRK
ncbi:hypothetical protein BDR26DRAFT_1016854 [Obelidium mucronatum]|nr:hypothetical protein BDR26DRAFT_1016854 [Obelidium mucronatum]